MKLQRIVIRNFGSFFGTHEFILDGRGLVLVLGDNKDDPRQNSNGGGKTTLFRALRWCLFGKVPSGDHVDSVVNDEAGRDCAVTTYMVDDQANDLPISMTRFRKMNGKESGVSLTVEGKEETALDSAETDRRIVELLGLDLAIFDAMVFYAQGERFNFATATDTERVDILTKVLLLDEIDGWLERFKARETQIANNILFHEAERDQARGKIQALQGVDLQAQLDQWEVQRNERLLTAGYGVDQALQRRVSSERAWAAYANGQFAERLAAARAALPQPDPTVIGKMNEDIAKGRAAEAGLMKQIGGLGYKLADLSSSISRTEKSLDANCPTCGRPLDKMQIEARLTELRAQVPPLELELATKNKLCSDWTTWVKGVENSKVAYEASIVEAARSHQQGIQGLIDQAAEARVAEQAFRNDDANYQAAVRHRDSIQAEVNPFRKKLEEVATLVRHLESIVEQQDHLATDSRTSLRLVQFWVQACGPKGLKSYILDARLAELNESINQSLKLLFGGTHWARVETQTMGRSSEKLSNKINVRIFRHNPDGTTSERNYRSWSGGEQRRISLAVDMGLSRLVAARASKRYNLVILDEVFEHLDAAGRNAVVDLLHQLQYDKSSIFVIDHDVEFQGAFHSRVTVTKQNRRSSIVQEEAKSHAQVQQVEVSPQAPPSSAAHVPVGGDRAPKGRGRRVRAQSTH